MAQVKLDISEYELMKENSRLLKESLDKEVSLNKKIALLEKEKLDALIANEKSVTIVTKTINTNKTRAVRNPSICSNIVESSIYDIVESAIDNHVKYGEDLSRFQRVDSLGFNQWNTRENLRNNVKRIINTSGLNNRDIQDLYYEEKETSVDSIKETVTRKGLDQVESEIRQEVLESLTKKSREALVENVTLSRERIEVDFNLKKEEEKVESYKKSNILLSNSIDRLNIEVSEQQESKNIIQDKLSQIILIAEEKSSIFTNGKIINNIKKALENNE